jgi:alpha-galactosidase
MTQNPAYHRPPTTDTALATRIGGEITLNARHPAAAWPKATPLRFSHDWQGKNLDPERETELRLLWTPKTLYARFVCRYRDLFLFEDSDANGRRDHLWDRDVAELFLQSDPARPNYYKEFEVGPNGLWIDLDIFPGGRRDLQSGLNHSAWLDTEHRIWTAELAIPMQSLTEAFDPTAEWRANFYRIEGRTEPRFYSAWQPTKTNVPNFHVPGCFGKLRFQAEKE